MNQIKNDFVKGLGQLGQETVEKLVETPGKIVEPIITAQELLGDIKPLSEQDMAKKQAEDEKNKRSQMADLRSQISGRNVESEVKQISDQKKKEEEEKEKIFLENLRRQREIERQNQMNNMELMQPKKQHKDKGGNKHKTQQPDATQMSQTSEFKGKID